MMRGIFFIVTILGWLNHSMVVAQEIHHVQYGLTSPLQTNRIYDIHLAQDGLLYIATDNGFWSYNGVTFTKHQQKGLRTEDITHIQEDSRGRLFFHNFKGMLFVWDSKEQDLHQDTSILHLDFTINNFCLTEDYLYCWNRDRLSVRHLDTLAFRAISPPNDRNWLFQNKGQANFIHQQSTPYDTLVHLSKLTPNKVITLPLTLKASVMPFYSGYGDKGCIYDPNPAPNGRIITEDQQVLVDLNACSTALKPLFVTQIQGRPWVACRNGLYLPHLNQHYLKEVYIPKMLEDQEGNIWLATINRGLLKIPKDCPYYYPSDGQKVDVILKHEAALIFSNVTGDIFHWSYDKSKAEQFWKNNHKSQLKNMVYDELSESYIYSGVEPGRIDRDLNPPKRLNFGYGTVYTSASGWYKSALNIIYSRMNLRHPIVYDPKPTLFTNDLLVGEVHNSNSLPLYNLQFHTVPKDGLIHKHHQWILALHQDTLTYVHHTKWDSIRRYTLPPHSQKIHLKNDQIWIEFEDALLEYDAWGKVCNRIPRINDLEENISHLSVDDQHIVISTKGAIYLYDAQTMQRLHKFTTANAIASVDFDKAWLYEGALYVNGSKGVSVLSLGGPYHRGHPKLWVNKVTVQKEEQSKKTFEHDQNALQIHFEVRSFTTHGKLYWRLNKNTWKEIEGKPQVGLESLQYGSYIVEAYFENDLGARSPLCIYQFVIKRPYWLQWWFLVSMGVGIVSIGWGLYRFRLHQINTRNSLENHLIASQITALKSQMNPHFVFNALNSIQSLVRFNKNKEAYKYINKFATLLRQTLHYSDKDFIPLGQEVELLRNYLDMENMRLDGKLDVQLEVDGDLNVFIPAMIIQPFVENAIKHGLLHKKNEDKQLCIRFELQETLLFCTIVDNGIGRAKAKKIQEQRHFHESFSTGAIQKRLELLQQLQHQELGVHYTDLKDEQGKALGTKVCIILPIQN